ncbi:IS481 family transposase [Cellulomonas pakistanensis]|uniref:IS481 family transposase n=1 Tax=Cellulomonas pakistanensis TaxID=992287 RepID=A0A919U6R1_9CELL|nr:IS481 family transposase [Cellulomonas pakistanensis]GIG36282.1 IS481 family transposase [Cellulomonas pakistanensis]
MSHANARLTPAGRLTMVQRIAAGRPVAHVAAEMGVSRTTAWRWWRRFQAEGPAGLVDRSSVAHSHPRRTAACVETRVRIARMLTRRGPVSIGRLVGLPASTVGRVLHRHRVPRLADCDPLTGHVIRATRRSANRYEHPHPGSLVHIDVKKLGRIPDGGGWRAHGRSEQVRGRGIGYDYVHTAIDDHSRLAYAEIHTDEKGTTAAGFLARAAAFYAGHGIRIERVISDNAFAYRNSRVFHATAADLGIVQKFIRPHCPWTNGKVERLNRTLATEWAYSRIWSSNADRAAALPAWLQHYNLERPHLGIGGLTPIDRVNNATGQYS